MELRNPPELIVKLRSPSLRVRTGLWLVTPDLFGQEEDEAARLGIDAIDIRRPLLASLPNGTRYLGLDIDSIVDLLDSLCRHSAVSDCALIYNFDLLVTRLKQQERQELWRFLYATFARRARALLFVMPRRAENLLPMPDSLLAWRRDGRLVD